MSQTLKGKTVAILVTDGFEQIELTGPRQALEKAGAEIHILSDNIDEVRGWNHDQPADTFSVDSTFEAARIDDYDALLLPGGVINADQIRSLPKAQELVKRADHAGKPIAVICHGAWLLVSAGLVKGRTLTSWNSLKDDISNAGGHWVDRQVVKDGHLISSRKPDDIPAFNKQLIETLAA
ncbi:type 1 glutamine amidotransferase [Pseudomonas sp. ZM23]|uniref:Type 1 glutamine amidotransferase n=1 Tax=Pseudomonas triclosanedens TaxID=2961893 RepID=A0ABY6ZWY7_9PSED|nr:type 1 glutamine amidotransferase domain-containing protein [Pseudomonas triclosanedens]MCP8466764.1 type 1 glutamine amidotransferase [Pseudomonas triclosanedens]MCP8469988.1 type 1 glutamine amidotransferase [Pseudomonas triclosanedens]MCP8477898.1 type 1 glutamine amidotransferase [Pseudomonas triclosanedens]WAI49318.1 type 1 glutamine amidotransferase [Pseudomonas triclosanedens]